ncbi:hypothetical protein L1987_43041 [Smallanthus sonchifolius]|uniref:Uncharacterized protein n=1 Tax=Smallanthus sonchifolius TaxID=185202 RepID=A0ACB9GLP5_9ASTR|nr:hypothetical protein L1987_43041 [Smallanthus sonchifolius]
MLHVCNMHLHEPRYTTQLYYCQVLWYARFVAAMLLLRCARLPVLLKISGSTMLNLSLLTSNVVSFDTHF